MPINIARYSCYSSLINWKYLFINIHVIARYLVWIVQNGKDTRGQNGACCIINSLKILQERNCAAMQMQCFCNRCERTGRTISSEKKRKYPQRDTGTRRIVQDNRPWQTSGLITTAGIPLAMYSCRSLFLSLDEGRMRNNEEYKRLVVPHIISRDCPLPQRQTCRDQRRLLLCLIYVSLSMISPAIIIRFVTKLKYISCSYMVNSVTLEFDLIITMIIYDFTYNYS